MEVLLQRVIKLIESRLDKKTDAPVKTQRSLSPDELSDIIDIQTREQGMSENDLAGLLDRIYQYSLNTDSPFFMNQMFGNTSNIALLADILLPVFNTSMYTYEVAPVFTLMEKEIIHSLSSLIWNREGDGVFTGGGSLSNMYAIFLAIQRHSPRWKEEGLHHAPKFSIFLSEQAHYSFHKGTSFLGLGHEALELVSSDNLGKINPKALEEAIEHSILEGRTPLMITAIAGTTKTGSIDPLEELAELAQKYNLWFHVDAAFGGAQLFHPEYKSKLKGIEKADSVTWNFHKVMGMPLSTSSFLTREKNLLSEAFSVQADYLFHDEDYEYNLGQKSLRGGRRPDVFKLWLSWKYYGKSGFSKHVDSLQSIAETFSRMIEKTPDFELFTTPETSIVCFRYQPGNNISHTDLNTLNTDIRNRLIADGRMLINYTEIHDKTYLRCVILDPDITRQHLENLIKRITETAKELLKPA